MFVSDLSEGNYYVIRDGRIRDNAVSFINGLPVTDAYGKPVLWEVDIKRYRKNRSRAQNRLYWKWLGIIGNQRGQDPEDLHEEYKHMFLPKRDFDYVDQDTGEITTVKIPRSTSKLNTKEFTQYLLMIEIDVMTKDNMKLSYGDNYREAMK